MLKNQPSYVAALFTKTLSTIIVSTFLLCSINSSPLAEPFSKGEEGRVKELVREYILENPEIIAEAITLLQGQQETARKERQKKNLEEFREEINNPPENTIIGNPNGSVTVVEFFDYNCGYCKSMTRTVMDSIQNNQDIRLVLIELPILGPTSVTASRAALASRTQDLYGPFHLALMNHRGNLNDTTIMTLARGVGLNIDQLKTDMEDSAIDGIIEKNRSLAQSLDISGTPAFIIGSSLVPGALPQDQFEKLIEEAAQTPRPG